MSAAKPRLVPTTTITLEIPVRLKQYLERLVYEGLDGCNVEEVAHWIIAAEIRRRVFEEKSLPRLW